MNRKLLTAAISALLPVLLPGAAALAQDSFTVRTGGTLLLTSSKYHSNLFAGPPAHATIDLKLGWKGHGGSVFDDLYNHPQIGVAVSTELTGLCSFAGTSRLDNIYNVYGYFDRPIVSGRKLTLQYTMGLGCGFTGAVYHPVDNPWNRLFSTRLTYHVTFGLELFHHLESGSDIGLGVYYAHNSNGTAQLPNSGFNGIEAALTLRHNFEHGDDRGRSRARGRVREIVSTGDAEVPAASDFRRRFCYDVYAAATANVIGSEFHLYDSCVEDPSLKRSRFPVHPKFAFGGDVMYRYGRRAASGLGVDIYWMTFARRLHELDLQLNPDTPAQPYRPVSVGVSAQQEFFYRNISLRIYTGVYLFKKDGQNMKYRMYEGMSLRYYVPRAADIFFGLNVKAHNFAEAECVHVLVGKRF